MPHFTGENGSLAKRAGGYGSPPSNEWLNALFGIMFFQPKKMGTRLCIHWVHYDEWRLL
jgi:hypothetical protein